MDILSLLIGLALGWFVGALLAGRRERDARVRAEAQVAALGAAEERLSEAFRAAAAEALQGNSQQLVMLAEQVLGQKEAAISGLVKPLQDALRQYEEHLTAIEAARQRDRGELTEQLRALAQANDRLQRETGNLVTALRSPTVRGRWGELALRRVVELAGMVEHCDFHEQASVQTEGGRLRPDMTVHLPGGRALAVDSKVSVDAYLTALGAATDDERESHLQQHARQLRSHMQQLARKEYWNSLETSPDFVVMFVAVEASLAPAMARDTRLFEEALEQRVIIATPSFLVALLLTVAHAWRQERLARNALELGRLGKELYDRLGTFLQHFAKVSRHLQQTVASYNEAVGSLQARVLPAAQRLREAGAAGGGELPEVGPITMLPRPAPEGEAAPAEPPPARLRLNPDDGYGE